MGSFPALNCRSTEALDGWLAEIAGRLGPGVPHGVNLIVHRSNPRLEADLGRIVAHRVPVVITSLGAVPDIVGAVRGYGGVVLHDVIGLRHAEKAVAAGVDGLIAVCAGAGGHAGTLSPFAFMAELRAMFSGTIALAGGISTGAQIAAARLMGADLAYLGTRFLATRESLASEAQKAMTARARTPDIIRTDAVSGVPANFLRESLIAAGLDPEALPAHGALDLASEARAWATIWSAGHGAATIRDIPAAADLCARLIAEHDAAIAALRAG
jgi:nitronate monooxygenase